MDADVIIVGGGPAGLSCALVLGRCQRTVIVFDTGRQRNRRSHALNGFLSRDGVKPPALIKTARKECLKYGTRFINEEITAIRKAGKGFRVRTGSGETFGARKILLATGLLDELPPLSNADAFFGTSVFHCPFCDGWDFKGLPWVVYARTRASAVENCLRYRSWTNDVTLLARHVKGLTKKDIATLT